METAAGLRKGDAMAQWEAKGTAVLSIIKWVTERFGDEGLKRWQAELSPEARALTAGTILASSWYSGPATMEMRKAIIELFFQGDVAGVRELGRFSAHQALSGIYKLFVKLGSPGWVVERAGPMFSIHFRPGEMSVVNKENQKITLRLADFPDKSGIMEQVIWGFVEIALQMSGAKEISIELPKQLALGHPLSEFLIQWK
jgi:hypothetical protein